MKNLTKSVSIVLMVAVLSLALIGCQSTAPVDSVPEIVVPVPAPAAEAPAPAPVVEEEVAAPAAETAPEAAKEAGTLSFHGYTLSYEAVPGEAKITYPAIITEGDVDAFFAYAFGNHSDVLSGVYYDVTGPGEMTVTFPESVTVADAAAVVDLLAGDLETFAAPYL